LCGKPSRSGVLSGKRGRPSGTIWASRTGDRQLGKREVSMLFRTTLASFRPRVYCGLAFSVGLFTVHRRGLFTTAKTADARRSAAVIDDHARHQQGRGELQVPAFSPSIVDGNSGPLFPFANNPRRQPPSPSSLTKIMTLYICCSKAPRRRQDELDPEWICPSIAGSRLLPTGCLRPGPSIAVEDVYHKLTGVRLLQTRCRRDRGSHRRRSNGDFAPS